MPMIAMLVVLGVVIGALIGGFGAFHSFNERIERIEREHDSWEKEKQQFKDMVTNLTLDKTSPV